MKEEDKNKKMPAQDHTGGISENDAMITGKNKMTGSGSTHGTADTGTDLGPGVGGAGGVGGSGALGVAPGAGGSNVTSGNQDGKSDTGGRGDIGSVNNSSGMAQGSDLGTAGENTSGQVGRALTGSTDAHQGGDADNIRATDQPGRAVTGSTDAHRAAAGMQDPEANDADRLGGAEDSRSFDRNEQIDNR
jgi:hypothetical protein